MSRHRTMPDSDILMAAFRVIERVGPNKLTLADVAKESGLAPATLLQRFGSKRGLLLAASQLGAESMDQCFAQVRAAHPSPLAALFASFEQMASHATSPEAMANSLAFLQIDLTDPDFHRLAVVSSRAMVAGFRALLDDAISERELIRCDTGRLARALHAASSGSMLTWAILREDSVVTWMRNDMETLLSPYRTRPRPRTRGRKRKK
jgi:AcrR family transcriptional regulator